MESFRFLLTKQGIPENRKKNVPPLSKVILRLYEELSPKSEKSLINVTDKGLPSFTKG